VGGSGSCLERQKGTVQNAADQFKDRDELYKNGIGDRRRHRLRTLPLPTVSWQSTKPQFANMRGNGIVGKKAGTLAVSARVSGATGSTTVVVGTGTLLSGAITPANPAVVAGATQQFTATGTFSDGTTEDVTINTHWSSTVPTVATIANAAVHAGLATTFASGTSTIGVNRSGTTTSTNLSAN
jgi:trimeric autotransporter adhesin